MHELRDQFLSEDDLDLRDLSDDELIEVWNWWLELAQATNELDASTYSHGVFDVQPVGQTGDAASEEKPVLRPE